MDSTGTPTRTERQTISITELTAILDVSAPTVYRALAAGDIPARRVRSRWIVFADEFWAWRRGRPAREAASQGLGAPEPVASAPAMLALDYVDRRIADLEAEIAFYRWQRDRISEELANARPGSTAR